MRPKITTCHHVSRSILYNEQKVERHVAERLAAANLLKPLDRLAPADILHRFSRRMGLNDRVHTSLHITLNFDPQDQLTNEQMQKIAYTYMKEIGFERQPWIAWRHHDSGHPHCHIVTTHVQVNGDPIDLYKIGENQSEKARLQIEREFRLVTKEIKREQRQWELRIKDKEAPLRLTYGEQPLARALSDIVEYVTEKYRYTNLQELNAVLRLYNVEAYTGQPGTKLYESRGLLYRALDEHGHYIGRPLKASFFDSKPTLENLGKKFVQNERLRQELREHVENVVCWELFGKPDNLERIREKLGWEGIQLSIRQDKTGAVSEVTYVDVQNKVVFTGKDLHPTCNAQAVQQVLERQKIQEANDQTLTQTERQRLHRGPRLHLG
jgi:hypothetical protein